VPGNDEFSMESLPKVVYALSSNTMIDSKASTMWEHWGLVSPEPQSSKFKPNAIRCHTTCKSEPFKNSI
jgi:hypothetical protein